jgi:hypothetical protein
MFCLVDPGRTPYLLKDGVLRKRKWREIEETKEEEEQLKKNKKGALLEYKRLKVEVNNLHSTLNELTTYKSIVEKL